MKITTIIVTYNRIELLRQSLGGHLAQSRKSDSIVIVNNASTDGTEEYLNEIEKSYSDLMILNLSENTGGAGGFSAGMKYAFDHGADYVWMMDDDAIPHVTALEELVKHITPEHIYGSLAVNAQDTSWATTLLPENRVVNLKSQVPDLAEVQALPFLGFLTSKEIYKKIGLPDTSYFIAADDVEYCIRAQQAGYKTYICGQSQIEHPKSDRYPFNFLGKQILCLNLVPWKRYYDTRNRLFIAKKYYGLMFYTQTLPASFLRLFAALLNEKNQLKQIKAFFAGLLDGVTGKSGKRHDNWNL